MMMPPNQSRKRQTFRPELVARVRQEIADGSYDTPEKLEAALERLFDSLSSKIIDSDQVQVRHSAPGTA